MKSTIIRLISFLFILKGYLAISQQHSVARLWNEKVLDAIRGDQARPTVHARNLFHTSVAMYDAWALYDEKTKPYLIGNFVNGYDSDSIQISIPTDTVAAREEAISYAVYNIIKARFANSPAALELFASIDELMDDLGYDINFTSTDYTASPAALGNYIAQEVIAYGLQDGSNEINDYANTTYEPVNEPLIIITPGNPDLTNFNRWQPLQFDEFVDQSGNVSEDAIPLFLSAEWGQVSPFALKSQDRTVYNRDGFDYYVYHDPGDPAYLTADGSGTTEDYIWGNTLVAIWSSHLDSNNETVWDISPNSIGNVTEYPSDLTGLRNFYDYENGGDTGMGYDLNPKTGVPYEEQLVKRADYARVLAEFWADGPDSETPPGHWFTILNYVNDQPELEKRIGGEGAILSNLEWDVKSYFILGGAMHDAAIAAWGVKGWYDYIRPVSAIRGLSELGQSSDPNLASYHPAGLPLISGMIELIEAGDDLEGTNGEHIGKLKLYAWKGPDFIDNPEVDEAGVGWIYADYWFPYQRPSFVTPPFAGYVSGHSTFSRAAAEVLTAMTGDPYFPGGLGEFFCAQNEFLVFEEGPSEDLTLQWATYRDASDQSSLSRIWGGIHPPVDDIPGRLIGEKVGLDAYEQGIQYFDESTFPLSTVVYTRKPSIYPNPVAGGTINLANIQSVFLVQLVGMDGRIVFSSQNKVHTSDGCNFDIGDTAKGVYILRLIDKDLQSIHQEKLIIE